jgi:hypothetical protein
VAVAVFQQTVIKVIKAVVQAAAVLVLGSLPVELQLLTKVTQVARLFMHRQIMAAVAVGALELLGEMVLRQLAG